jgi:hypothetical protein
MKKYIVTYNPAGVLNLYEICQSIPPFDVPVLYVTNGYWDSTAFIECVVMSIEGAYPRVKFSHSDKSHLISLTTLVYNRGTVDSNIFRNKQKLTEEELQKLLNPVPKEVMDLVEIMKKYGEFWKDDCGEAHLDDVKIYPCTQEILNYFKPKEDGGETVKETTPKKDIKETESFEQIVKKRKEDGQQTIFPPRRRHILG